MRVVSWLVFALFYCLHLSYRYRYYHFSRRASAEDHHPKRSFLLALWHEHLFASLGAHSFQGVSPIISLSKDGEIVTYVATKMGMEPVRGSSSRGGRAAKDSLEEKIRNGLRGAITVDGPRGPRRQPKLGIFHIASATGTRILPSTALADRYWTLRSWDQFKVPKPFARIAIVYGEPITVHAPIQRAELPAHCERLTQAINELDALAESSLLSPTAIWTNRSDVLLNARSSHG
jgi:lysophospholipid acyltransferase (LPLAT)-like uncharacterized protein